MLNAHSNDATININNSFTELFGLIKKCKEAHNAIRLDYELTSISQILFHSDNAIIGILHGLQCIGKLVGACQEEDKDAVAHIGYFISLIANLIEALHILRLDCENELIDSVGVNCGG